MAQYLSTNTLIASVKRRANIPENQATFSTPDFLAFINEELSLNLVPSLLSLHEDYLLYFDDIDLVDEDADYAIPSRAVGNKLRDVQYLDSNNNQYEMTRISIGDIPDNTGAYTQNRARTFYIQNNRVHLIPPIQGSASGKLRMFYYLRPSELVEETRVGVITGINTSTGEVTVSSLPTHFSTSLKYDLYKHESPHRQLIIDINATSVNSSTNTITFATTDVPSELVVGDHIAQATECIIPQVPSDLHVVLAQYVAERILEAQGDTEGLRNAKVKSREMEIKAGNIIDNRVEDAPIKLVNRHGALRYGLSSKRYRRRN